MASFRGTPTAVARSYRRTDLVIPGRVYTEYPMRDSPQRMKRTPANLGAVSLHPPSGS